jgi:hypothetical protein
MAGIPAINLHSTVSLGTIPLFVPTDSMLFRKVLPERIDVVSKRIINLIILEYRFRLVVIKTHLGGKYTSFKGTNGTGPKTCASIPKSLAGWYSIFTRSSKLCSRSVTVDVRARAHTKFTTADSGKGGIQGDPLD